MMLAFRGTELVLKKKKGAAYKKPIADIAALYRIEGTENTGLRPVPVFLIVFQSDYWVFPASSLGSEQNMPAFIEPVSDRQAVFVQEIPWDWREECGGRVLLYPDVKIGSYKIKTLPAFTRTRRVDVQEFCDLLSCFEDEEENRDDRHSSSASFATGWGEALSEEEPRQKVDVKQDGFDLHRHHPRRKWRWW